MILAETKPITFQNEIQSIIIVHSIWLLVEDDDLLKQKLSL